MAGNDGVLGRCFPLWRRRRGAPTPPLSFGSGALRVKSQVSAMARGRIGGVPIASPFGRRLAGPVFRQMTVACDALQFRRQLGRCDGHHGSIQQAHRMLCSSPAGGVRGSLHVSCGFVVVSSGASRRVPKEKCRRSPAGGRRSTRLGGRPDPEEIDRRASTRRRPASWRCHPRRVLSPLLSATFAPASRQHLRA